ncbi:hypothetical protein SAMD00019534_080680 [Acytostelium subglobosum LB1]|uniref:hypothetical protein n=1 Tax=Acytostelium subglobosum LB1 TaxID=1410327 RepID=UPI000645207C|nr:hypothetical protein SAMD00019534_080680 [Acytostelium subglobosum LB1]GAM24893.1 hypothetical protein SAMD00019534_080680 [Acytostelium subglobosum LB1]|eukprot:XP_012751982.1 hypothetical protein SAMD00019534_080680 [Acytostelium subglobosum LB1]
MDINHNHLEDIEQPVYYYIRLPWDTILDSTVYNKFVHLNEGVPIGPYDPLVQKIKVPVATPIDISPLVPYLNLRNPLDEIEEINDDLIIETEGKSILWIKEMAGRPSKQNVEFTSQLRNWNINENTNEDIQGPPLQHIIGHVFDGQSAYRFVINGVSVKRNPDAAFMTNARWVLVPNAMKDTRANTTVPDFIVEVRSFGSGENNQWDYQHRKMCRWMATLNIQAQSGILFDRRGGRVCLYCRNDLPNLPAQVAAQQANTNNQLLQVQQSIQVRQQRLANPAGLLPDDIADIQSALQAKQQQLQRLQWQQVYFQGLAPVGQLVYKGIQENYPNVSFIQIPLNLANNAQHGPNIIIHCIGAVNGLRFDLSTIPLD